MGGNPFELVLSLDLKDEGHISGASGLGCRGHSGMTGLPHVLSTSSLQEERSRSEHNLVNIQKTHERMQTENKSEWLGPGEKGLEGGVGQDWEMATVFF